jgi:hypothetical protein
VQWLASGACIYYLGRNGRGSKGLDLLQNQAGSRETPCEYS